MSELQQTPKPARREQAMRDAAGILGLALITLGVGLMSVPWALIVAGVVLLGLSLWGAIRSDRHAARNQI